MGIGDLGIGDWAQSPIPNPQSPNLFDKSKYYNQISNKLYVVNYIKLNKYYI